MPSRWYRANLRNNFENYQKFSLINNNCVVNTVEDTNRFSIAKIQTDICKIIESITLRTEFDKVLTAATDLRNTIKTKADLLQLITTIEDLVLSIISNLASRTGLDIVLQRLAYLKELVNKLEPNCCISYDGPYVSMLMNIFTMITEAVNINDIQTSMTIVFNKIHSLVDDECLRIVKEAEELLVSIMGNLADRVSLDIVSARLSYLQEILGQAQNI